MAPLPAFYKSHQPDVLSGLPPGELSSVLLLGRACAEVFSCAYLRIHPIRVVFFVCLFFIFPPVFPKRDLLKPRKPNFL